MAIKLSAAECQDLANFLFEPLMSGESSMQQALDRLLERFEIHPEDAAAEHSSSARNSFQALMKNLNGTDKLLGVLSFIVENKVGTKGINGDIAYLQNLLTPHGYTVHDVHGRAVVQPVSQGPLAVKRVAQRSWIEAHAPPETTEYLTKAYESIGKAEWQDALSNSRLALESLTKTEKFDEGLQELIARGIIEQGDNTRKKDAELLRAIYGFDSTYGSHSGGSVGAQPGRARFGLFDSEDAVFFLLSCIEAAQKSGKPLAKWKSWKP